MTTQYSLNSAVGSSVNPQTYIASKSLDGATAGKETLWSNPDARMYWGMFDSQPDLQTALLLQVRYLIILQGGGKIRFMTYCLIWMLIGISSGILMLT
jgi:hypothetical protein